MRWVVRNTFIEVQQDDEPCEADGTLTTRCTSSDQDESSCNGGSCADSEGEQHGAFTSKKRARSADAAFHGYSGDSCLLDSSEWCNAPLTGSNPCQGALPTPKTSIRMQALPMESQQKHESQKEESSPEEPSANVPRTPHTFDTLKQESAPTIINQKRPQRLQLSQVQPAGDDEPFAGLSHDEPIDEPMRFPRLVHDGVLDEPAEESSPEPSPQKMPLKLDACIARSTHPAAGPQRADHSEVPTGRSLPGADGQGEKLRSTTVTLFNVPRCYTQLDLALELDFLGFGCCFNYVYMPGGDTGTHMQYAVVNFVDATSTEQFMKQTEGYVFRKSETGLPVRVAISKLQGLAANLCSFNRVNASRGDVQRPLVIPQQLWTSASKLKRSAIEMAYSSSTPTEKRGVRKGAYGSTCTQSATASQKVVPAVPPGTFFSSSDWTYGIRYDYGCVVVPSMGRPKFDSFKGAVL